MYKIYCITDKGNYREVNEDKFLVNQYISSIDEIYSSISHDSCIVAVCDGVGGNNYGEIASQLCLEELLINLDNITFNSINEIIKNISINIINYTRINKEYMGMSTTLCGVKITETEIDFFNVGDTRSYILNNGYLRQVSKDHTLIEYLYEEGEISRIEKDNHPLKNRILQSIGGNLKDLNPYITKINNTLDENNLIMICSDGISDYLSIDEMENVINQNDDLSIIGNKLIKIAKDNKSKDNLTIALIKKY